MDDFRSKAARCVRREEHTKMAKTLRAGSSKLNQDQKKDQMKRDDYRGEIEADNLSRICYLSI